MGSSNSNNNQNNFLFLFNFASFIRYINNVNSSNSRYIISKILPHEVLEEKIPTSIYEGRFGHLIRCALRKW